jgi:hypothetical protein
MTTIDLPDAVVISDIDDPDTFLYAPKRPSIAVDDQGRRQLNVLGAGAVSFLQVTSAWGLDESQRAALRAELARRNGRPAASLKLRPLPETIDGVVLLLAGDAGFTELQRSKSSGVPPYHAAFNVTLDPDQLALVRAALDGERSRLLIRYDVTRRVPVGSSSGVQTEEREVTDSADDGGWRQTYTRSTAAMSHEILEETESLHVTLDAADWMAAR